MPFISLFPPYTVPNLITRFGAGTTFFAGWRLVNGLYVHRVRVHYRVFGVNTVVSESGFQLAAGGQAPATEAEFTGLSLQLTSGPAGGVDFEDPVLVSAGIPTEHVFECNFEADESVRFLAFAVHSQQATDVIHASIDWSFRRKRSRGL